MFYFINGSIFNRYDDNINPKISIPCGDIGEAKELLNILLINLCTYPIIMLFVTSSDFSSQLEGYKDFFKVFIKCNGSMCITKIDGIT